MTNGFVPLRRGILAHIRNVSLPHGEALAYMVIIASADPSTGIWYGSAKALAGEFNFPEREARRLLEALERKGYLRLFPKPGAHSNYPVLVNKSEITVGARRGTRLCADKSTSLENLVYEDGEEAGEQKGEHTREETCEHTAPIRELKRKREKTMAQLSPSARVLCLRTENQQRKPAVALERKSTTTTSMSWDESLPCISLPKSGVPC